MQEKLDKNDLFKIREEILIPDERLSFWKGEADKKLDKFHESIDKIKLDSCVPIDLKVQFETAKNVLLYSFYSYRMSTVAKSYAYSVFERSLLERIKLEKNNFNNDVLSLDNFKGLKRKLDIALKLKWFTKEDFFLTSFNERSRNQETLDLVFNYFSERRNELIHEPKELDLIWNVPDDLMIIANLINKTWKC